VEEKTSSLSLVNVHASDGALRHINCPSSSSKPGTRRSLLRVFNLALSSELTPRKGNFYESVWHKDSVLCKFQKKYKAEKLEDLCNFGSDPVKKNLPSCSNY
jgi:hypothetical protein